MPYLCAVFDDSTQTVITEAAGRFAASSPFVFEMDKVFHIPLIGALHVYAPEEISAAVAQGFRASNIPIEGRFVRWEASASAKLRVVVELEPHEGLVQVSSLLPRGKEWRDVLYVEVGSLAAIDRKDWPSFVEAAAVAFPITESSTFVCTDLDYVAARPPKQQTSRPDAAKQRRVRQVRAKQPPLTGGPHKKWSRPGSAAPMDTVVAAMEWETGATGNRATIRKKHPRRARPAAAPAAEKSTKTGNTPAA